MLWLCPNTALYSYYTIVSRQLPEHFIWRSLCRCGILEPIPHEHGRAAVCMPASSEIVALKTLCYCCPLNLIHMWTHALNLKWDRNEAPFYVCVPSRLQLGDVGIHIMSFLPNWQEKQNSVSWQVWLVSHNLDNVREWEDAGSRATPHGGPQHQPASRNVGRQWWKWLAMALMGFQVYPTLWRWEITF